MAYRASPVGYRIEYGSATVYDSRDSSLSLASAKLDLDAKGLGKLVFSMPPTHPMAQQIQLHDFQNFLTVWHSSYSFVFGGYATDITTNIDGVVTVTAVEGIALMDMPMTCLADHGYNASQYKMTDLFDAILACYNQMAPSAAQFSSISRYWTKYGDIGYEAVIDGTLSSIAVACDPKKVMTPWQMLKEWVVDPYDTCVHYVYNQNNTPPHSVSVAVKAYRDDTDGVERGVNMTSIEKSLSSAELVTGLYVTGGKILSPTDETVPATSGLYLASTARRGDTSIQIRSNPGLDYTINDGDKIEFDGNVYEAYLPLSRSMNVYWTSGQAPTYTLPLTRPVQKEIIVTLSSTSPRVTVSAYASDAKFAEAVADLSDYNNSYYSYAGIMTKVKNKVIFSETTSDRYGLIVRAWSNQDCFLPSYLRDMAIVALKESLVVESTFDADVADNCKLTGWMVNVKDGVLGIDEGVPVTKARIDMLDPTSSSYELGATKKTLVARVNELGVSVKDVAYSTSRR